MLFFSNLNEQNGDFMCFASWFWETVQRDWTDTLDTLTLSRKMCFRFQVDVKMFYNLTALSSNTRHHKGPFRVPFSWRSSHPPHHKTWGQNPPGTSPCNSFVAKDHNSEEGPGLWPWSWVAIVLVIICQGDGLPPFFHGCNLPFLMGCHWVAYFWWVAIFWWFNWQLMVDESIEKSPFSIEKYLWEHMVWGWKNNLLLPENTNQTKYFCLCKQSWRSFGCKHTSPFLVEPFSSRKCRCFNKSYYSYLIRGCLKTITSKGFMFMKSMGNQWTLKKQNLKTPRHPPSLGEK